MIERKQHMIKTDIDIRFAGNDLTQQEWNDIWEILCECNNEFVPPLSSRNSSSQADLRTGPGAAGACAADQPFVYFEELRKQQFIVAVKDSRVVGFLSFRTGYICDALSDFGASNYITTVCVRKDSRKQGILTMMYELMETCLPDEVDCDRISTRTWSQNDPQINTLMKKGFSIVKRIPDDRGPGVDTLYFGKVK